MTTPPGIRRALVLRVGLLAMVSGLLLGGPGRVCGQTIRGQIVDSSSGEPVMLAYVGLLADGQQMIVAALADTDGAFSLEAPEAGSYFVYVARSGYETLMDGLFELGQDGVFDVRIGLTPQPLELDPVLVEAEADLSYLELQGFYDRAIADRGTFLIREEIARRATHRIADAFHGIPLLEVDASVSLSTGAGTVENPRLRVRRPERGESCAPTLYIDRHVVANGVTDEVRPDDFVSPFDVDAIEVYTRSSEVPLEFDEVSDCGVIVIWTRTR